MSPLDQFTALFNQFHEACLDDSKTKQRRAIAKELAEHGDAAVTACVDPGTKAILATISFIARNYGTAHNATWEINKHWPSLIGMLRAAGPSEPAAAVPSKLATTGGRMTKGEASVRGDELLKEMGQQFLTMSDRHQAKLVGCSWATWKKSRFYLSLVNRKRKPAKDPAASRNVVAYTKQVDEAHQSRQHETDAENGEHRDCWSSDDDDEQDPLAALISEQQADDDDRRPVSRLRKRA